MTFIENGIDIHDVFFVECKQLSRPSSGTYSLVFGKYPCTFFFHFSGLKGAHDTKIGQNVGIQRGTTG